MAGPARLWCQKNLATVKFKSEDTTEDDALEPYVIRFDNKEGKKGLKILTKELGAAFLTTMSVAVAAINAKDVMTSRANAAFDDIEEVARVRTLLLKVAGKRGLASSSALLLYV